MASINFSCSSTSLSRSGLVFDYFCFLGDADFAVIFSSINQFYLGSSSFAA